MKKLIVVLLVALLAVALVACGSEDETTAPKTNNTTPTVTTTTTPTPDNTDATTPEVTTNETPNTTEEPPVTQDGYDILWNYDDPDWNTVQSQVGDQGLPFFFEDSHGSLDFHQAMIFVFMENAYGVYPDLFIIPEGEIARTNNTDYKWVITVNGRDIEVNRFSLFDNGTSGWVRADLGKDFVDKLEFNASNECEISAYLKIYGSDGKVAYYADLTPDGTTFLFKKPNVIDMIADESRDANLKRLMPENMLPYKGPDSGNGEGYKNLFDNDVRSKLCGNVDGEENAIIVNIKNNNSPIVGISLVNANDNQGNTGRTVTKFEVFVSKTGNDDDWKSIYLADGTDGNGNEIDKSTINTNYAERYFKLKDVVEATDAVYVKLVINNGEMAQLSEFILWTE